MNGGELKSSPLFFLSIQMKLYKYLIIIFLLFFTFSCGPDTADREKKKKAVHDSIRRADSLNYLKGEAEAMKKALEDSVKGEQEYEQLLAKYDSVRAYDSLKLKYKKHRQVKPAPKRQLWGKSPVK